MAITRLVIVSLAAAAFAVNSPALAQKTTGASSHPTRTGPTACVWAHLPDDFRVQLIADRTNGTDPAALIAAHQGDIAAASNACSLELPLNPLPLWNFAALRAGDVALASINVKGDDIEAGFLAMTPTVQEQATWAEVHDPDLAVTGSDLLHEVVEVIRKNVGATDTTTNFQRVSAYILPVIRLLDEDKHVWLKGHNHAGASDCVYTFLPLVTRNEAFYAEQDGKPTGPIFEAHADQVEAASRACFLGGPMAPYALSQQATIVYGRARGLLDKYPAVDRALDALPDAGFARLANLSSAKGAMVPDDAAWISALVNQIAQTAGVATEEPTLAFVRRYIIARTRILRLEGVK